MFAHHSTPSLLFIFFSKTVHGLGAVGQIEKQSSIPQDDSCVYPREGEKGKFAMKK
jgi:hypothetical protein